MISEHEAIEIAKAFAKSHNVRFASLARTQYFAEEKMWVCCFMNEMAIEGYAESPGVTIVEVNPITGEAKFFDAL